MYASLRPAKDVFIDGVLGYGTLNFESNRYITMERLCHWPTPWRTAVWRHRQRCRVPSRRLDVVAIRPLELMSARLDQYTETASALNALTYFKQPVRTTSGTLGVRTEGHYLTSIGTWMPRARLEFRHQFQGRTMQGWRMPTWQLPSGVLRAQQRPGYRNWSAGWAPGWYCVTARCLPLTTTRLQCRQRQ